jgi:4-diphosphocytidyl-2-C-methyl-D-erythritol kinase
MQSLYDLPAPAKLNLFLHITGQRADGYHLLQSVFMLLDWCDQLNFDVRNDGSISREDLSWALPEDDLCVRAARALQHASQCPLGVHIGIRKSVPAQAGMGGGSSDAATTLLALNRLWKLDLSLEALSAIGLTLGADVPFFLGGHNAWVEGVGEKITPIALAPERFVVLKPDAGLETRLIFSDPSLKRDTELAIISGFATNAFGFGRNDLQAVAQKLCPVLTKPLSGLPPRA